MESPNCFPASHLRRQTKAPRVCFPGPEAGSVAFRSALYVPGTAALPPLASRWPWELQARASWCLPVAGFLLPMSDCLSLEWKLPFVRCL